MSETTLETSRRMPLMELPLRTTVLQLGAGRVMFSPSSTLSFEELQRAGEVTDIVVPNMMHDSGFTEATRRAHPNARLWGPARKGRFAPQALLGRDRWPYEDELSLCGIDGQAAFHEFVLVHHATRTLLVGDLAFNLVDAQGLGARLFLGMFGTYRRFGVSRLFLRYVRDRTAFTRSLQAILAHDFDRLIPTHGAILEGDANPKLRTALAERGVSIG